MERRHTAGPQGDIWAMKIPACLQDGTSLVFLTEPTVKFALSQILNSNKNKMGHDSRLWYRVHFLTGMSWLGQSQEKPSPSMNSKMWQCEEMNWRLLHQIWEVKRMSWQRWAPHRAWSLQLWPLESDGTQETARTEPRLRATRTEINSSN